MRVALLGLPQAGKKTLFSLLAGRTVPPGRKETEAVEGTVPVRDTRVDAIAAICKPEKKKYAETIFVLCPDISTGDNKRPWLESARKCDLLCMLVRSFASANVYHPFQSVDPARDRAHLATELLLADLELIDNRLARMAKEKRGGQAPVQALEEKTLGKCREAIEKEKMPRDLPFDSHELDTIKSLGLLTLKPVLWACNVDEKDLREDAMDPVTIACQIEKEIMDVDDAQERMAFLKELGLSSSGVDRLNRAAYNAMGLMSFYTMGEDEVRAWTIRKGSTAPVAAGKVHTDMERGFIRVEIVKYDDLVAAGSEAAVKQQGKLELKGKDYVVQDGDICHFLFNV